MATTKKQNNSQSNLTSYILAFIVGAGIVYFGYPYLNPQQPTVQNYSIGDAQVDQVNGLYVFLESKPVRSTPYKVIDSFEDENLLEVASSVGIGKEKFGKVLENILTKGSQKLNFENQIDKITQAVKDKYPDAQAVIFSVKLKRCEVITFEKQ